MEIKGEELHLALAQAVLTAFKPEQQSAFFRDALHSYLFDSKKDSYGNVRPSAFTVVFEKALEGAMRKVIEEYLVEPAQMNRIRELLAAAFTEAITAPDASKKLVERFAGVFSRTF